MPAQSATLYLYRTLDVDDDGDPLDHGVLRAASVEDIPNMLREHFRAFFDAPGGHVCPVRVYPLVDVEVGVLPNDDDRRAHVIEVRL